MDWFWWMLLGTLVGFGSRRILKTDDSLTTGTFAVVLGIMGACFGGYMVETFAIAHAMAHYFLWSTIFAIGVAGGMVTGVGILIAQPLDT